MPEPRLRRTPWRSSSALMASTWASARSLAYFAVRWRRDRRIVFSAILAFVSLFLSLGSPLAVNGHSTLIRLTEAVLTHIPIYDNIVPARFSFVVWLFAVIALTLGGDRLIRTFMEHRSAGWVTRAGRA